MFLRMNKGLVFNDDFLRRNQLDGFLRIPMSVESFTLPNEFIDRLRAVVEGFAGVGQESNRSSNEALLREIKKNNAELMTWVAADSQKARAME